MDTGVPCLLAYSKGDYAACERLARAWIEEGTFATWTPHVLVSSVRRQRRVEEAATVALTLLAGMADRPWHERLLRVALGSATLATALSGAPNEEQRCQAHYHAGAFFLGQGNAAGAERAWQACRTSSALVGEKTLAEIETLRVVETLPIESEAPLAAVIDEVVRREYMNAFREHQDRKQHGDLDAALELAQAAHAIAWRAYGGAHELVASGLGNIGDVHRKRGEPELAETFLKQSVDAWRATEGETGASTLLAVQTLATFFAEQSRFADAEPLARHVHDVRAATLGPAHAETVRAANTLAQLRREAASRPPPPLRVGKPPSTPPVAPSIAPATSAIAGTSVGVSQSAAGVHSAPAQPLPSIPPLAATALRSTNAPRMHAATPAIAATSLRSTGAPSAQPSAPPAAGSSLGRANAGPKRTQPPAASFPRECQPFVETATTRLARTLGGYTWKSAEAIEVVLVRPDEAAVVTFDAKGRVILWDAVNGQPLRSFAIDPTRDDSAPVTSADLSRDGDLALVGRYDGYLQLLDLSSATCVWSTLATVVEAGKRKPKTAPPVQAVAFSPDGEVVASTMETEDLVRIWDAQTGSRLGDLPGKPPLAFSPDGGLLWAGETLYDARSWAASATVRTPDAARFRGAAFSGDGAHILLGGTKGSVVLFDARALTPIWTAKIEQPVAQHVGFDKSGNPWAVAHGFHTFDLATGKLEKSSAFSADSKVALAPNKNRLFGVARGSRILKQLEIGWGVELDSDGHADIVKAIDFDPRGDHVITASFDGTIRVWHLPTAAPLKTFAWTKFSFAAYFPDGKRVLGASDHGLRIYDVESGAVVAEIKRFGERHTTGVALSPDGARICLTTEDGHATMIDVATQSMVWRERLGAALPYFSRDGRRVRIVAQSGEVYTHDAERGRLIEKAPSPAEGATPTAFLDDGARALSAIKGEGLVLRELRTAEVHAIMPDPTQAAEVLAVAPDEKVAATRTQDGSVALWDIGDASMIDRIDLRASGDRAECAGFSPDGALLLVGTARGVVLVFERKI